MNAIELFRTTFVEGHQVAARWGIGVATGLMALTAVASLIGFLLRKYSS